MPATSLLLTQSLVKSLPTLACRRSVFPFPTHGHFPLSGAEVTHQIMVALAPQPDDLTKLHRARFTLLRDSTGATKTRKGAKKIDVNGDEKRRTPATRAQILADPEKPRGALPHDAWRLCVEVVRGYGDPSCHRCPQSATLAHSLDGASCWDAVVLPLLFDSIPSRLLDPYSRRSGR